MHQSKRVLITGSTGFIGNYITRVMAASNPSAEIFAMSRKPADASSRDHPQTARFSNVQFVQGDCLKPETYPGQVEHVDTIIHTVGAITDAFDYKKLLKMSPCDLVQAGLRGDQQKVQQHFFELFQTVQGATETSYENSLEAQNRDSVKLMAEKFNISCKQKNKRGTFVFMSAEESIFPLPNLVKYAQMKREAEIFLKEMCNQLDTVVLRPGLVWHKNERSWTYPLSGLSDISHMVGQTPPPSTSLSILADYAIHEALMQHDPNTYKVITANQMFQQKTCPI